MPTHIGEGNVAIPLYTPPKSFCERLKEFDSALRVRWSDHETRWRVERKITRAQWVNPSTYHESLYEDFVSAREGYVPVLFCEHNQLDDRVFFTLWMGDMWRRGGATRVAEQMEDREAYRAHRKRAGWLEDVYNQAKEHYFTMNSLSPTRTSTDRGFSP